MAIGVAIASFWPRKAPRQPGTSYDALQKIAVSVNGAENTVIGGGNAQTVTQVEGAVKVVAPGGLVEYIEYGPIENLYVASAVFATAPPGSTVNPRALLFTYLNQVVADTSTLNLTGVDRKTMSEREEARLELAAVYTALDTVGGDPADRRDRDRLERPELATTRLRRPVLDFAAAEPYAALLGDPGSGKTTFTNYLALCLAGEMLGLSQANLRVLGAAWTAGALLPMRVVLREFAAQPVAG